MSDDPSHRPGIAQLARELARSGKCRDIIEIEAALIMQGYAVQDIQNDTSLRAELEMLLEDAHSKG